MIILAFFSLAVALAASVWTIVYAWNAAVPDLLWLDRVRRWDAWLDSIDAMHETLDALQVLDNVELLEAA